MSSRDADPSRGQAARGVIAAGSGTAWNDRRNTSRARAPDPLALARCLEALAALRRADPALVRWIEDGHPRLTDADHRARFGTAYQRHTR